MKLALDNFVANPDNPKRVAWDVLLMTCLVWVACTWPQPCVLSDLSRPPVPLYACVCRRCHGFVRACESAGVIPFMLCFDVEAAGAVAVVNHIIDAVFIADLILNFFTGKHSEQHVLISC